ncbi:tonsoku-like protein [Pseudomyrmex gracilis]|uniref:tonsoku-like protein n=1 Tax=Pseudomyrmex gracilis TaxID=219809 RepID=UPI000994A4E2|nr:tonsoku-like protein [Pseudomyrmex gracilis]XP_020299573.1 tonsoku-like protein [Pseudomyrmex gracilis]
MYRPETSKMSIDKLIKRKQHAKRDNNLSQLAEITKALGDMYFETEQPRKALQEYAEQLSICEKLGDKLNCAVAHRMIGEIYASLGDYEQALIHQNLHLEGARDMRDLVEEQRAFATLGRTYFCQAESLVTQLQKRDEALANAKAAYVKSMELCDKLEGTGIKMEEKLLMRARLLLNLGLTLETQKETQQAITLIEQAAALCLANNFQEDLHRTCLSLAGIYERLGNHELVLQYIETASTVGDVRLKAEAKLTKAEFYMRTGQWIETRKILISLYTSSGLSRDINNQVEKYLRIIVTLCRAENNLLVETDTRSKQKLYETLGDAAVAAQCFDKAVEYYRQMLICAEKTGDQIGISLESLAQTLKDAGRHKEALTYAQREFELCTSPQERCRSALFLADLLITTNASDQEIRNYYTLALASAKESNSIKLQKSVTKDFVIYLENINNFNEAKDVREEAGLEELSDTESETSFEESDTIGADICLEDLSDLEENTKGTSSVTKRRTKRPSILKKNEKGETQLQVACINGDINTVQRLLSSGHPVNVRDNAGWSPLHEAANYGYVDIAELLIKSGANINDNVPCRGMTPLHDAALCGHFSVMNLLMEHGADVTLKTHDGDTVLDYLEDWRDRVEDLNPEDLAEYDIMHKKLSAVILTKRKKKKYDGVRTLDKKSSEVREISAGEDYKRTIAHLRTFNKTKPVSRFKSDDAIALPFLVNEEQVLIDDWLEDDIGITTKKKSASNVHGITTKRRSADENMEKKSTSNSHGVTTKRKSADGSTENAAKKMKRNNSFSNSTENIFISDDSYDSAIIETASFAEEPTRTKRKQQTSLLTSGFTKSRTPSPSVLHIANSKQYNKEHVNLHILVKDTALDVKVAVCEDEKEFLSRVTSAVESKFFDETGCTVKLQLRPTNGNIVTRDYIVNIASEMNDRLECEIVELQIPPIVERYKTICRTCNLTPCDSMLKCLKSCENTSIFRAKPDDISEEILVSLLKTLEYEKNIKLLQLSDIVLLKAGTNLYRCLSNLSFLQELYLKGCDIDSACLRKINSLPPQLRILDLSYNPLTSKSCDTLRTLIAPLRFLQTLNLRYCQLDDFCFPSGNPNLTSYDISWNKLSRDTTSSILSKQLFDLNLSNTLSSNQFISSLNITLSPSLEFLDLSFCDITDDDVKIILTQLPRLSKLTLRGNTSVSLLSVNMLLSRHPTLTHIDVTGCECIASNPEAGLVIHSPEICTLVASVEPDLCDSWIKLWRGTGIVTKLPHKLAIFKPMSFCG